MVYYICVNYKKVFRRSSFFILEYEEYLGLIRLEYMNLIFFREFQIQVGVYSYFVGIELRFRLDFC